MKKIVLISLLIPFLYPVNSFAMSATQYALLLASQQKREEESSVSAGWVLLGVGIGFYLLIGGRRDTTEEIENTDQFALRTTAFEDGSKLKLTFEPIEQQFLSFDNRADSSGDNLVSLSLVYKFK